MEGPDLRGLLSIITQKALTAESADLPHATIFRKTASWDDTAADLRAPRRNLVQTAPWRSEQGIAEAGYRVRLIRRSRGEKMADT